jgi:hypothetical protein
VPPEAAGLPSTPRRRTPGLRREELATLAGVSAEYIVRLEQGRAAHPIPAGPVRHGPGPTAVGNETGHMFHLAGVTPPDDKLCDLRRTLDRFPAARDSDLYGVVFTVEPGAQDASRLDLLRVTGTQSFASAG